MHNIKGLILLIFAITISAQDHDHDHGDGMQKGVVRGSVINQLTELPLQYATITIINSESNDIVTGAMSDSSGVFFVDDIPYGKYKVEVERIGYEQQIIEDILIYPTHLMIDIEVVKLASKAILMEGVTIREKAPIIEEIAKTTYPVKETARESGGSAEEVLEQIPQISVDIDGNITLRGNSNVKVLINGRKSNISVNMLNADMIEKVEVMTIPDAKYDPDGTAGIINIVLSNNEYVGTSGNIGINVAEWHSSKLSGTINRLKNDFNIFSSFSFRDAHKIKRSERLTEKKYSSTSEIIETIETATREDGYPETLNLRMGFENYFNEKSMIAFDITYIDHESLDTTKVATSRSDDSGLEINETESREQDSGYDLSYGFGYFLDDEEHGKHFDVQFDYEDFDDKIIEKIDILDKYENEYGTHNRFRTNYKMKLSDLFNVNEYNAESTIETGLSLEEDIENIDTDIDTQNFNWDYSNKISAIYFNTQYQFSKKMGIQIGTRFESHQKNSIINYNRLDCPDEVCLVFNAALDYGEDSEMLNNGEPYVYDKNRIYPSLYFNYKLSESNSIKFGAGRRINRPGHYFTNPIPNIVDYHSRLIRMGNPRLDPEDMKKVEISFINNSYGYFKTTIFYDDLYGSMDWDKDNLTYNTQNYDILTQVNLGESTKSGLEVTFYTKFSIFDLMFYGQRWHHEIKDAYEDDQIGSEYGFWGMLNLGFKLKNDQKIKMNSYFSTPLKITTGEIKPFRNLNISYGKKVNDKFSFNLKLKNVFNTAGFGITNNVLRTYDDDQTYTAIDLAEHTYTTLNDYGDFENRRGKRTVSINFEYRFGAFEDKKYRRDDHESHGHGGEEGGGMQGGY